MQKSTWSRVCAMLLTIGFCNFAAADNSLSGQAIQNASSASLHGSASVAHAIAASGQVTFAASAIPLGIGGAVSGRLANDSINAAHAPIGTPLPITGEVLTITPPDVALKNGNADTKDNL